MVVIDPFFLGCIVSDDCNVYHLALKTFNYVLIETFYHIYFSLP